MPVANVASAVLGAATGIGQFFDAQAEEKKAKRELAHLKPAFYKVQDEYLQNKNQAEELAGQGYTSAAKDYLTTETERGLGTAIGGISSSGGSPNDYSKLFDVYQNSINKTAAQDSEKQVENIQRLMAANKDYAGQKSMANVINEIQPYQNKLKELTQRAGAAKQNKAGGIDTLIGSISAFGTGQQNQQLVDAQVSAFGRMNQPPATGGQQPQQPFSQQPITLSTLPGATVPGSPTPQANGSTYYDPNQQPNQQSYQKTGWDIQTENDQLLRQIFGG